MQKKIISNTLNIGTQLDKYIIDEVLGQGGFGIVYRATDLQNRNLVAIKEFFPSTLSIMRTDDQTQISANSQEDWNSFEIGLEKFRKEATALAQFQHPNIVQIIDYIKAFDTEYFVMPYERGITLADYVKSYGSLSNEEIINLLVPILNGLDMMHQYNIFHRDIKPDNIFLREDGMPMLIDFGAARQAIGEKSQDFTQVLTHGYAPPEQYETKASNQGAWSDIYALGASFYFVITGERPPPASDRINALISTNRDPIVYPYGDYDSTLINSLMKATNIKRENRFQSVNEWLEALFSKTDDKKRTNEVLPIGFQLQLNDTTYLEILSVISSNDYENRYKIKYVTQNQEEIGFFNEFYPRVLLSNYSSLRPISFDEEYFWEIVDVYKSYSLDSKMLHTPQLYISQNGIVGNYQILDDGFITLDDYVLFERDINYLDEKSIIDIGIKVLEYLKETPNKEPFLHLGIDLNTILIDGSSVVLSNTGLAYYCNILILKYLNQSHFITQAERDYNYILADGYIDVYSDIYALGVVMYRLMVGIDKELDSYMNRLNSDIDPYTIPKGYSIELIRIVMRAIAINEKNRIASIDEFIDALKKI
jgi:serine/threonine protein kinase